MGNCTNPNQNQQGDHFDLNQFSISAKDKLLGSGLSFSKIREMEA